MVQGGTRELVWEAPSDSSSGVWELGTVLLGKRQQPFRVSGAAWGGRGGLVEPALIPQPLPHAPP